MAPFISVDRYCINLSPQALNGNGNFTSTNASINLIFDRTTLYHLDISLCSDMMNGVQFHIGMNY